VELIVPSTGEVRYAQPVRLLPDPD